MKQYRTYKIVDYVVNVIEVIKIWIRQMIRHRCRFIRDHLNKFINNLLYIVYILNIIFTE